MFIPKRSFKICIYVTRKVFPVRNRKIKLCTDFYHYSQVRNELCKLTRMLHANYEHKLVSNVRANPRQFQKYANSQLKLHPKIDSLHCSDNTIIYSGNEKVRK